MEKTSSVAIFGARGLVGSAILKELINRGYNNILTPTSSLVDLTDKTCTKNWFKLVKPEYVFFAAAKVGGIQANIDSPVDFGIKNIEMINNVFMSAQESNVKKLLYLGSSCIYPANCQQPMKEEYLFKGPFEPTNEMYAISKAYGLRLCSAFCKQYGVNYISCQPCNIYGPNDNYDPKNSHVVAALIRKFHDAFINNKKEVVCWGDGQSRREILYSEDLGEACVFLMENYNSSRFLNVGMGIDISIKELSEKIAKLIGYTGEITWDTSKPNGMRQKLLDTTNINNFGWQYKTSIDNGLKLSYNWFVKNIKD